MPYTIGACGFSGTGSSVITDYLKEFDDILVKDSFEFTLAFGIDGLNDLRYHLVERPLKHHSYCYIKRFENLKHQLIGRELQRATQNKFSELTNRYIDDISMAKWVSSLTMPEGKFHSFVRRVIRKTKGYSIINYFEEKHNRELKIYPLKLVNYSSNPQNFDDITKGYISDILCAMGWDKKKSIALDQPFAGNNPQVSFRFFDNPKAIVVDRDPRDCYLMYKKFYYMLGGRQAPVFDLKAFVKYYISMREGMPYKEDRIDIMRINFEEMIYDYEKATKKIRDFCGVKEHTRPKVFFDPSRSISNTQLFKRFPEYKDHIKYIEDNLTEYIFPFEKYQNVNLEFGKLFDRQT